MNVPSGNWRMIVALPGVDLLHPVDGGDLAAIGSADPRYAQILETQPGAKEYLSKFKTPFGVPLKPSVIAAPAHVEKIYSNWISEFRSIVAIPHVIRGRMDFRTGGGVGAGPTYSELFDFYPIALGKDPTYVTIQAPGETGLHMLSKFEGSYPFVVTSAPQHTRPANDDQLSDALLQLWRSQPADAAGEQYRSRVFRSLFMADYALRSFYASFGSILDAAMPLALWISAFEPLAAPEVGDVKTSHVVELIDRVPWERDELRDRRHAPTQHTKPGDPVTFPVQVYGRLHRLRDHLLHGRPLPSDLEPNRQKDWGDLKIQVPALYRSTLLHMLSSQGFGKFETEGWDHDLYEEALLNEKPD